MNESTKQHSKLGIASCVIALMTFLMFLIVMVYWTSGIWCPGCAEKLAAVFPIDGILIFIFAPIPVHTVGLILGVVSLFFPNRKKLFPIIGITLNLIFGAFGLFPILLGMVLAA
jgi:hypothetical protein